MRHDHAAGDPSRVTTRPDYLDNHASEQLAADALAALKELGAHGTAGVPLLLRFGETLFNAKVVLKHGEFSPWCVNVLKRSPSWCSAHRRLYETRDDLVPARAWAAAINHKWANCSSVERLVKLISEWKRATRGDGAAAPRTRAKKRTSVAYSDLEEFVGKLEEIIREAKGAFETVRYELWLTAPPDDGSVKEELVELGNRFRSRLRDLGECCGALQVSKAGEAPSDLPPPDDAPEARLLQ
jgi:hypothetical protein